jgi:hypothetical protein
MVGDTSDPGFSCFIEEGKPDMPENITLTKASMLSLLDSIFYPNPDDSGPIGPGGPVIRDTILKDWLSVFLNPQPLPPKFEPHPEPWRHLLWVLLNPQPLPPRGPSPDPWRILASVLLNPQPLPPKGPHPDPWRAGLLTRAFIDHAVTQAQQVELNSGDHEERGMESIRMQISEFVDDYCGTRGPRRWPPPWPGPLGPRQVSFHALDLLAAGAQFQKAADAAANSPLHADFTSAADRLFETGVGQLEQTQHTLEAGNGQQRAASAGAVQVS